MTELAKCIVARAAGNLSPTEYLDLVGELIGRLKLPECHDLAGKAVLIKTDFSVDTEGNFRVPAAVVRAVARYFLERGATVKIGDSPLGSCLGDCGTGQRRRLSDDLAGLQVEWSNFEADATVPHITKRRVLFISEVALSADLVVNLASYRDDLLCRPHGAMANLIGLLPGYQKAGHLMNDPGGQGFARLVLDVLAAVSPALSVVCASPEIKSHAGDAILAASRDAVALDTLFFCILSGRDTEPSTLIRYAAEAGLGMGWPELIELQELNADSRALGLTAEQCDSRLTVWPSSVISVLAPFIWSRPNIQPDKCHRGCTRCSGICPTQALNHDPSPGGIGLRPDRCMGCWRCREICPDGVISVERSPMLNRLLSWGAISAPR